ncbi:hypothetical protein [Tersicoccus sp. Bi-70]|uniref:hypothetical protein n=1 Tax=Tersicoccus sp. Bi-70 TaxID=1897634 RepID=UPI001E36CD42|nr:hypothetical protein [Tersicoccus sp. Bi-70]
MIMPQASGAISPRPAGDADQVGDHLQRQGPGQVVDRVELPALDQVGDHRVGLGVDLSLDLAQRARRQVLREHGTHRGVRRRVRGERRALQRLVHLVVEGDLVGGEDLRVGQGVPDAVVAAERPQVVRLDVHDGGLLAQPRERRVGIGQDLVGEQIDVGGRWDAGGDGRVDSHG